MRTNTNTKRSAMVALGGVLGGFVVALTAVPAHAAEVKTVCNANSVYLRTEPVGPLVDNLPAGSHFAVDRTTPGGWSHGISYYDGRGGWVDSHYLC